MPHTSQERYAVVSCHVERPLDDRVWARFAELQERRPGGLAVAALLRPPDAAAGERVEPWLERAAAARERGPVGHHTHFTGPGHARPSGGDPGARVLEEGRLLAERGVPARSFCGGGWYTDASVAAACAELGYVDCTPRAKRPGYLDDDAAWAELAAPAWLLLDGGARLLALPTTHSVGTALRELARRGGVAQPYVHLYFHDTDLVDRRRRAAVVAALALLGRRRAPSDLDALAAELAAGAPERPWRAVARGRASGRTA